jgi:hypothetical protein
MLVLADGRASAAVRHSGATRALLPIATERGVTHLKHFGTFLPKIYARR